MSARLSEEALRELDRASRELGITKKQFLEEAIHLRAQTDEAAVDEFEEMLRRTSGAWVRNEPPEETVRNARQAAEDAWESRRRYLDSLRTE